MYRMFMKELFLALLVMESPRGDDAFPLRLAPTFLREKELGIQLMSSHVWVKPHPDSGTWRGREVADSGHLLNNKKSGAAPGLPVCPSLSHLWGACRPSPGALALVCPPPLCE